MICIDLSMTQELDRHDIKKILTRVAALLEKAEDGLAPAIDVFLRHGKTDLARSLVVITFALQETKELLQQVEKEI